jgi:predicted unusual protein kinase regulating ubiquinone biosynthesis (AarF/ABC1/UbiB family)
MLMEELDFYNEARYQELFRQQARRDGQPITAPKVYAEYGGKDVIVSELIRGVWLQDLIDAQELQDVDALRYCATLDIDPETVARRLLQTLYWSNFENSFYHADPHPANLVVRPGSELVFLDFGACGPTTHRSRRNYMELFGRQDKRDIRGMVQVFSNINSPLPPMNLHAMLKDGEALTARWQYGFDSKFPEWWERSSAGMWIGLLELTRRYNIPVTIETVRLVRSSLLYDTIAARLCDSINMQREFARYRRAVQRRTLRRLRRDASSATGRGQPAVDFDRFTESLQRHLYGFEHFADKPVVSRRATGGAWAGAARALGLGTVAALVTALGLVASNRAAVAERGDGLLSTLAASATNPWSWVVVALLAVWCYRTTRYRSVGAVHP